MKSTFTLGGGTVDSPRCRRVCVCDRCPEDFGWQMPSRSPTEEPGVQIDSGHLHSRSQVISRMTTEAVVLQTGGYVSPVSGGRSAPSDGHGVDRNLRKPELLASSSLSSLVYTTTKAKTEVTACSTSACIDAVGARVADAMQSPSSSEIGPTILYDEDESSTSDVAPGSAGNVGSCAIPPPHTSLPQLNTPPPHTPLPPHHG